MESASLLSPDLTIKIHLFFHLSEHCSVRETKMIISFFTFRSVANGVSVITLIEPFMPCTKGVLPFAVSNLDSRDVVKLLSAL
jgi:hypothetical protein